MPGAPSDMSGAVADMCGARSDITDAPADITGAQFYRSGGVPEVYDHLRVRSDRVAGAVARLILCSGRVPEYDGQVSDRVGYVPDRVAGVNSCSGEVRACSGQVPRCVGYVRNVCDGVSDQYDAVREYVAHFKTCDGAEIFLNRPIITRSLNISLAGEMTLCHRLSRVLQREVPGGIKALRSDLGILSSDSH